MLYCVLCHEIYLIDFLINYIVWPKQHSFIAECNLDYMSLTQYFFLKVVLHDSQWYIVLKIWHGSNLTKIICVRLYSGLYMNIIYRGATTVFNLQEMEPKYIQVQLCCFSA